MAKPVTTIHKLEISAEEQHRLDAAEVEALLIEHKDALKAFLELLTEVNKRGVLEMGTSLFQEGDDVLHVIVKAVDRPEAAAVLRNGLLLLGLLGKVNVESISSVLDKLDFVSEAAERVKERKWAAAAGGTAAAAAALCWLNRTRR